MYPTQMNYQTPQQQYQYPWSSINNSSNFSAYNFSPAYNSNQLHNYSTPTSDYNSSYYESPTRNGSFIDSATESYLSDSSYYKYQYSDAYYTNNINSNTNFYQYCHEPSISHDSMTSTDLNSRISGEGSVSVMQEQDAKSTKADFATKILPYLITNEDGFKGRRSRHAFSADERHYLLTLFKKSIYPSREVLEEAANKLKTTHIVIQTWFKNTRSKQKKMVNKRAQAD